MISLGIKSLKNNKTIFPRDVIMDKRSVVTLFAHIHTSTSSRTWRTNNFKTRDISITTPVIHHSKPRDISISRDMSMTRDLSITTSPVIPHSKTRDLSITAPVIPHSKPRDISISRDLSITAPPVIHHFKTRDMSMTAAPVMNYYWKFSFPFKKRMYSQDPTIDFIKSLRNRKKIALWLFICCGMIFLMVVLGGVTRLTESGLSITEWRPITGIVPPMSHQEWEEEFKKYKQSPEFKQLNAYMTLEEFKKIFWMEWGHRALGRLIGFTFGIPLLYFLSKGYISTSFKKKLSFFFILGGLQGFIGWWMVKSGLKEGQDRPRVSPYRLATHLGSAFVIYLGLLWTAMELISPVTRVHALRAIPGLVRHGAHAVAGLTFLTAMSGAFVAGLDAGLLYPEIPYMGKGLVPSEYWELQPAYKNFFENGSAAQFNHRLLATTTWITVSLFWVYTMRLQLPSSTRLAINSLFGMANIQVALGILTLIHHVPIPVAATHQAGSLTLLSIVTWIMHQLKYVPKIK